MAGPFEDSASSISWGCDIAISEYKHCFAKPVILERARSPYFDKEGPLLLGS